MKPQPENRRYTRTEINTNINVTTPDLPANCPSDCSTSSSNTIELHTPHSMSYPTILQQQQQQHTGPMGSPPMNNRQQTFSPDQRDTVLGEQRRPRRAGPHGPRTQVDSPRPRFSRRHLSQSAQPRTPIPTPTSTSSQHLQAPHAGSEDSSQAPDPRARKEHISLRASDAQAEQRNLTATRLELWAADNEPVSVRPRRTVRFNNVTIEYGSDSSQQRGVISTSGPRGPMVPVRDRISMESMLDEYGDLLPCYQ